MPPVGILCAVLPHPDPIDTDGLSPQEAEAAQRDNRTEPRECFYLGLINAQASKLYHIEGAVLQDMLKGDSRQMQLMLLDGCRLSSLTFPAYGALRINDDIEHRTQSSDITITHAGWSGYDAIFREYLARCRCLREMRRRQAIPA